MKECRKCMTTQPEENFGNSINHKDGLTNYCRKCNAEYHKEWYHKNKDKVAASQIKYQKENREAINEYYRKRYAENKEAYSEYNRERYIKSKDYIKRMEENGNTKDT